MEYWTPFILGLVGSLHCAGMCGPLALALPGSGFRTTRFFLGRLAYNLGRICTYCVLGIVFGLAGQTLWLAGLQRWASIALGLILLAGMFASAKLALWSPITILVQRLKAPMSVLLQRRSFLALGVLGLCNGLLPCGLVYVAGAGATATTSMTSGAEYMAAFGLGTIPMMFAISLSGKLVPPSLRLKLRPAIPTAVFLLASLLILRGLSLGIPYLSPNSSWDCCHK